MSPSYVSKDGVWHAAKEHAVLPHLSGTEKEVYDGPDRAAEFELFQAGVKTFGMNFRNDPDMINRAKQLGYKDVMEYAYAMGYDEKKVEEDFKAKAAVVLDHKPPERSEAVRPIGGGVDKTGSGKDIIGGFGDERVRPVDEEAFELPKPKGRPKK